MGYFENIVKSDLFKRIMAVLLLVILFLALKDMMNLLLLTFIFSYGFYSAHDFLYKRLSKVMRINRNAVVMVVYLALLLAVTLICIKYVPILINQCIDIIKEISSFDINSLKDKINPKIMDLIKGINIKDYLGSASTNAVDTLTSIGKVGFNVFMAFILSLFFVLEKNELKEFAKKLEQSRMGYIYGVYKYIAGNFVESFGKVLQMQFLVAGINGALSTLILGIMGFPQVFGLGFMVFVFGLIPVAGVIISLIPLTIIAFNVGGIIKIVYVLIMIALLHALESYVLNPKLMSAKTKLPVFITFAVLIVSEHFMGIWGLLLGLPIFMFLLKVLGIRYGNDGKRAASARQNFKA